MWALIIKIPNMNCNIDHEPEIVCDKTYNISLTEDEKSCTKTCNT